MDLTVFTFGLRVSLQERDPSYCCKENFNRKDPFTERTSYNQRCASGIFRTPSRPRPATRARAALLGIARHGFHERGISGVAPERLPAASGLRLSVQLS